MAGARRRRGLRGEVELYFGFDDPCSAIAVIDLAGRLQGRDVDLLLSPVVRRGIPGDPAAQAKRSYAVTDAGRLARRLGLGLSRTVPLAAEDTEFLAGWAAGADGGPALTGFCVDAMRRLWFESDGPIERGDYHRIWLERFSAEPPPRSRTAPALRMFEARMGRRGPYETPAAWIQGRWYFAHERSDSICEWLDELGWRVSP